MIRHLIIGQAAAQCVQCFRTASAQQAERAHVLNMGVLIMLIPAFLLLAGFTWLAYRRRDSLD